MISSEFKISTDASDLPRRCTIIRRPLGLEMTPRLRTFLSQIKHRAVFFDVGGLDGRDAVMLHQLVPNSDVYVFEAVPHLCQMIRDRLISPDYHIFQRAVSDVEGKAQFNVDTSPGSVGCSSLLDYHADIETNWRNEAEYKTWFHHTHTIEVELVRLDTIIERHNIKRIDHLHVDTQGNDLKVLSSLGKYIDIVQTGVIEAARVPLYAGQFQPEEALKFLTSHRFSGEITGQAYGRELNVYFYR